MSLLRQPPAQRQLPGVTGHTLSTQLRPIILLPIRISEQDTCYQLLHSWQLGSPGTTFRRASHGLCAASVKGAVLCST